MRIITHNFALKIVSLVISFVLWAYVTLITYSVPRNQLYHLDYKSLDSTRFAIVGQKPDTISIRVTGPSDSLQALNGIQQKEFVGYVDLINPQPGIGRYRIQPTTPDRDLGLQYQTPAPITLEIEPVVDIPRTVKVVPEGIPPGYSVSGPEIAPESVDLIGPESEVAQIANCIVRLDLTGFKKGQTYGSVKVGLYDAKGLTPPDVRADPDKVKVVLVLVPSNNMKQVPINLNWTGALSNYSLVGVPRVSPRQITLQGRSDVLDTISEVDTEPIDLSRIHHDSVIRVKLVKPLDGITPNVKTVSVSIRVTRKENAPIAQPPAASAAGPPMTLQPAGH